MEALAPPRQLESGCGDIAPPAGMGWELKAGIKKKHF